MFLHALPLTSAFAQSWSVPSEETPDFAIVAPGPDSPTGDNVATIVLDRCEVGYDGCLASDAGWSAPSSWSHITCRTELSADGERVLVLAEFRGGLVNDRAGWPDSFPATVDCTREINGYEKTYVVDLTDAPRPGTDGQPRGVHYETPIDPAEVSLTSGRTITIDDRWTTKAVAINLPDADYVAPNIVQALDVSSSPYPGVYCVMKPNLSDDWLIVLVLYGVAPGGTAYCTLNEGTSVHEVPVTVVVE